MGETWFYRLIFILSVVFGLVLPESALIRLALVGNGMRGLLVDQQVSKEKLEFEQRRLLGELSQTVDPQQRAEIIEAFNACRDLTLPAEPDEGY